MFHKSTMRALQPVVAGMMIGLTLGAPVQTARGDQLWREAKRYTASIYDAYEQAVRRLAELTQQLADAKEALEQARQALTVASASAIAQLTTQVGRAAALVAELELLIAAATKATLVTGAAVTAFAAGTAVGQGADYLISWCWDPICPVNDALGFYAPPTDAELEAWIPELTLAGVGRPMTRADFEEIDTLRPGAGTACWNYLRDGSATFTIAMRGAVAHGQQRCGQHLHAAEDLGQALDRWIVSIDQFAQLLPQLQLYEGQPYQKMQQIQIELQPVRMQVGQFTNPAAMQAALNQFDAAVGQTRAALDQLSLAPDVPQPVEGPNGVLSGLTLVQYQQFLMNCAMQGPAGLPMIERRLLNRFTQLLQATYAGQPLLGPPVAQWDGLGDTSNEAALFGPDNFMLSSEVIRSAIPSHWVQVDLRESPLVQDCQTPGDSNCSGTVDFDDIGCFVTALTGEAAWRGACGQNPYCDYLGLNDANRDRTVDFDDIDRFVQCLVGGC